AEEQNDRHLQRLEVLEHAEIEDDHEADERLEDEDELHLRLQIRLARLVNELRDVAHRRVDRRVLQLPIDDQSEDEPERANAEANRQGRATRNPEEKAPAEVRDDEIGFAPLRMRATHVGGEQEPTRQKRERERREDENALPRPRAGTTARHR